MKKIILIVLFCFVFMSFSHNEVQEVTNNKELCDTTFLYSDELNDSILYLALLHYDIKHPRAVLAQAKLESGNFTSPHFKNKNNFLGLYNSRRKEYFTFDHWTDCIQGYKNMIEYKLKEGEDYYDFLERIGYAENPSYVREVKEIENTIK